MSELDIRQWVDGWLREHRAQLRQRNVTARVESRSDLPKVKAVLRLEAPTSKMQVDLWGSGEADVVELRHGDITPHHWSFRNEHSLSDLLDNCFRRLAAG